MSISKRKEAAKKAHTYTRTHTHPGQWTGYLRGWCSAPGVWESTSRESDMVHTPHRHCGEKAALSPQTALWGSQRPSTLLLGLELVGLRRILAIPALDYFCLYTPTQRESLSPSGRWPLTSVLAQPCFLLYIYILHTSIYQNLFLIKFAGEEKQKYLCLTWNIHYCTVDLLYNAI